MTRVLLVATYELGQQPGNLGRAGGVARPRRTTTCGCSTCRSTLGTQSSYVVGRRRVLGADAHCDPSRTRPVATIDRPTCCFGLYARPLRRRRRRVISGEFEQALVEWVRDPSAAPVGTSSVELGRATSPDPGSLPARSPGLPTIPLALRAQLPPLDRYAHLIEGGGGGSRLAASVETTRGCAHRCRHCPVPVVYDGRVRVSTSDAVLADIAQLVAAGAQHITFGDPDFLNAPPTRGESCAAMHERSRTSPSTARSRSSTCSRHADVWPEFADARVPVRGLRVRVGRRRDARPPRQGPHHRRRRQGRRRSCAHTGIDVRPSWLPFTPWTTRDDVVALLDFVYEHDLVGSVDPVQYTIRLLLPPGSLLLDHPDLAPHLGAWDADALHLHVVVRPTRRSTRSSTRSRRSSKRASPRRRVTEIYAPLPWSGRRAARRPHGRARPVAHASPRAGSAAPSRPSSSSRALSLRVDRLSPAPPTLELSPRAAR